MEQKGARQLGGYLLALAPRANAATTLRRNVNKLAEGTIKRLTDRGFGFIDTGEGKDLFFHMSAVDGVSFDQLREGQRVEYTAGQGPKGPRAETVKPL